MTRKKIKKTAKFLLSRISAAASTDAAAMSLSNATGATFVSHRVDDLESSFSRAQPERRTCPPRNGTCATLEPGLGLDSSSSRRNPSRRASSLTRAMLPPPPVPPPKPSSSEDDCLSGSLSNAPLSPAQSRRAANVAPRATRATVQGGIVIYHLSSFTILEFSLVFAWQSSRCCNIRLKLR